MCGGPHAGAGEKSSEEGAAERNCYGLTATPNAAPPLRHLGLRRRKRSQEGRTEVEPWRGVCGKGSLVFVFDSYYPTLF